MIFTDEIRLETEGHTDVHDITPQVERAIAASQMHDGTVTIFCPGSTGAVWDGPPAQRGASGAAC